MSSFPARTFPRRRVRAIWRAMQDRPDTGLSGEIAACRLCAARFAATATRHAPTAPDRLDRRRRGSRRQPWRQWRRESAGDRRRRCRKRSPCRPCGTQHGDRGGMAGSLRVLRVCRSEAVQTSVRGTDVPPNRHPGTAHRPGSMIRAAIACAPDKLRDPLRRMARMQLIRTLAAWRPDLSAYRGADVAYRISPKVLARRCLELHDEVAATGPEPVQAPWRLHGRGRLRVGRSGASAPLRAVRAPGAPSPVQMRQAGNLVAGGAVPFCKRKKRDSRREPDGMSRPPKSACKATSWHARRAGAVPLVRAQLRAWRCGGTAFWPSGPIPRRSGKARLPGGAAAGKRSAAKRIGRRSGESGPARAGGATAPGPEHGGGVSSGCRRAIARRYPGRSRPWRATSTAGRREAGSARPPDRQRLNSAGFPIEILIY